LLLKDLIFTRVKVYYVAKLYFNFGGKQLFQ